MTRPSVRIVEGDPTRAGGADAIPIMDVPGEPFGLAGTTVTAVVDDEAICSAVLLVLVRGANAVVRVDPPIASGFVDAVGRIADVQASAPPALDGDQEALLGHLAGGLTTGEAAREIGLSLRTAHRRLRQARAALGASTNSEAIARIRASPPPPDPH